MAGKEMQKKGRNVFIPPLAFKSYFILLNAHAISR